MDFFLPTISRDREEVQSLKEEVDIKPRTNGLSGTTQHTENKMKELQLNMDEVLRDDNNPWMTPKISRDQVHELGKRGPYNRYVNFPVRGERSDMVMLDDAFGTLECHCSGVISSGTSIDIEDYVPQHFVGCSG